MIDELFHSWAGGKLGWLFLGGNRSFKTNDLSLFIYLWYGSTSL